MKEGAEAYFNYCKNYFAGKKIQVCIIYFEVDFECVARNALLQKNVARCKPCHSTLSDQG